MGGPALGGAGAGRTIDELAAETGVSVRTIRFYASKGLLPPPRLQGRVGLYDDRHAARLSLVRALQGHGFTLAAIEDYLGRVPDDATAEDLAVHRALLAPWVPETTELMDRAALERAVGRPLDDDALRRLEAIGAVEHGGEHDDDGRFLVRPEAVRDAADLAFLDVPVEMLERAHVLVEEHMDALARELLELLHAQVVEPWRAGQRSGVAMEELLEHLKRLNLRALTRSYSRAVDRIVREPRRSRSLQ